MTLTVSHEVKETPSRELAIVARNVIEEQKHMINAARKADPSFEHLTIDKFEPDIADFERAFGPYLERMLLRERLDVLRKYGQFAMITESVDLTNRINALNMQIAVIENPDAR